MKFLFLALTLPVLAISRVHADFLAPDEVLSHFQIPIRAKSAAVKLDFLNSAGAIFASCTGAVVSDEGHIFTTGHCLQACLAAHTVFEKINGVTMVNRERLKPVRCSLNVDGQLTEAKVLYVNDCAWKPWFDQNDNSGPCQGTDAALLKVSSGLTKSCLQVHAESVLPQTPVLALGYPLEASSRRLLRHSAKDTNGLAQSASTGQTLAPQSTCFKDTDPSPVASDPQPGPISLSAETLTLSQFLSKARSGELLQTSVDFTKGQTGEPLLLAATGELVGLGYGIPKSAQDNYVECRGSVFFISMERVLKDLRVHFPELDLRTLLSCRQKALSSQVHE